MTKFKLEIYDKEVSEWSQRKGQGQHIITCFMDLDIEIDTQGNELTTENISHAIKRLIGVNVSLNFCNNEFGSFDVIENAEGYADIEGSYIAFYGFTVTPIVTNYLDLQGLFKEVAQ